MFGIRIPLKRPMKATMEGLLLKFLNGGTLTSSEEAQLIKWLQAPENKRMFQTYVQIHHGLELGQQPDLSEAQQAFWERISKPSGNLQGHIPSRPKLRWFIPTLKYAALLLGLVAISYFLPHPETTHFNHLHPTEMMITLDLPPNDTRIIQPENTQKIMTSDRSLIAQTQSGTLMFMAENSPQPQPYRLSVPHGKRLKTQLADGSEVELNAGSQLEFNPENPREVWLSGEGYFQVKNTQNQPFFVHANEMRIEVLGTEFSVNTFENSQPFTVLFEGRVKVFNPFNGQAQTLVPGQKAALVQQSLRVEKVVPSVYSGWRLGKISFENQPFEQIIRQIERQYGVPIENRNASLARLKFTGTFEHESLEELIRVFQENAGFEYRIYRQKIIIY